MLTDLGVAGGRVLWCSMLSQAGQFWPYVCGTVLAGAKLSCADATFGEALRVSMFLRLMRYDAVLGVTRRAARRSRSERAARPPTCSQASVSSARTPAPTSGWSPPGCTHRRVVLCGPAIAIGHEAGGPACVPAAEWELVDLGDRIGITALQPRATSFIRTPIAVRGTIVDGGIVPDDTANSRGEGAAMSSQAQIRRPGPSGRRCTGDGGPEVAAA